MATATGALAFRRLDQGVDVQGAPGSYLHVPVKTRVDAIKSDPTGFGQVIYFTLLEGANAGQQLYIGHAQPNPALGPGSIVQAGDELVNLLEHPGGNATQPGWAEIGFASGGVPAGRSTAQAAYAWLKRNMSAIVGTTAASSATSGGGLSSDAATFVTGVSRRTGLDPRVVIAWLLSEGAYAQGGTGGYNYLNLRPAAGDVGVVGTSSGGFAQFRNVQDAIASTVARLHNPFARGILSSAHATPAASISAIAASGWDASHYGGAGGPNLVGAFESLFGKGSAGSAHVDPSQAAKYANSVNLDNKSAADWGSIDSTDPITKALTPAWVGRLGDLLGNLLSPNTWRRVGLILAGAVMLAGMALLVSRNASAAAVG